MSSKTDFFYDKRLTQRFIKRGLLSRADYERHLDTLSDVAEKAAILTPEDSSPESQVASSSGEDEQG